MDMIAVSESTPGPMGVNSATYAGFHAAGIPGALMATCSLVLPSVIIIILVSRALDKFRDSPLVKNGFYGLRPASAGLIFGVQALVLVAVTTLACVAFEYIYEKLLKKPNTVGDLSAVVTGIILALNMPVGMPLWIAVVGAFVAIVITKQLFGGLGYNFANPALVGRIVLFLGFTSRMTAYVYPDMAVDALASATPLAVADKTTLPLLDVFLGFRGGMMGEVCVLAILLGFAYLVATRTIQATIPRDHRCHGLCADCAQHRQCLHRPDRVHVRRSFVRCCLYGDGLRDQPVHHQGQAVLRRVYRPHHLPHPPLRLDE